MKNKRLLILLGLLVVLVLLVVLSGRESKPKVGPLYPDLQVDQVARIDLISDDATATLRKQAGQWLVATAADYAADSEGVDKLLEKTVEFKRTPQPESKNPKYHAKYGVAADDFGTEVKLMDANDTLLAHFYVGRSESDWTSSYVRLADEDPVYRIPESVTSTFDKGTRGWRDRTIFKFEDYEVTTLSVASEEANFALVADRTGEEVVWSLTAPEASPAKKDVVERMANTFSTLQTDEFPESQDLDVSVTGLDAPTSKVEATLTDGTRRILLIGKKQEEEGSKHYVQRGDQDTVFLLNEWRINQLLKKLEDIKEEVPEVPPVEEIPAEVLVEPIPDESTDE